MRRGMPLYLPYAWFPLDTPILHWSLRSPVSQPHGSACWWPQRLSLWLRRCWVQCSTPQHATVAIPLTAGSWIRSAHGGGRDTKDKVLRLAVEDGNATIMMDWSLGCHDPVPYWISHVKPPPPMTLFHWKTPRLMFARDITQSADSSPTFWPLRILYDLKRIVCTSYRLYPRTLPVKSPILRRTS